MLSCSTERSTTTSRNGSGNASTASSSSWRALATSRQGQVTLNRWRAAEPALAQFTDLEELAAAARGMSGVGTDLDDRDEVQRVLYRLAKHDPDAQLAALWLLAPALRRAAGTYVGMWSFDEAGAIAESSIEPTFERNRLFLDEMRHFLGCLAGDETPRVTIADGLDSLTVALAAKESMMTGRVIDIARPAVA